MYVNCIGFVVRWNTKFPWFPACIDNFPLTLALSKCKLIFTLYFSLFAFAAKQREFFGRHFRLANNAISIEDVTRHFLLIHLCSLGIEEFAQIWAQSFCQPFRYKKRFLLQKITVFDHSKRMKCQAYRYRREHDTCLPLTICSLRAVKWI